jgi:SagB-type dehydrogenase family enzyme
MADRKPPQKGAATADKLPAGPIGEVFMERTRYPYLDVSDQRRGLPQPPLELGADPSAARLALPDPAGVHVRAVDVRTAIEQRVSVRRYAGTRLTLAELSYLLWCTQGVKRVEGGYVTMRTVPSAGARHALETYLLINRVEGVAPGLYRYLAIEHELLPVETGPEVADLVTGACWGQQFVKTSAVTFVWTAVAYRMTWRYGQRGYRYMHLDAGHVCQNLYLAAAPIGCGVCAIAAFSDEDMSRILDIDGVEQFAIYVAAVGKKT